MPRKAKPRSGKEKGYVARSITLPPDVDEKLNAFATQDDRSLSAVVTRALRQFFESVEKKKS